MTILTSGEKDGRAHTIEDNTQTSVREMDEKDRELWQLRK